MIIHFHNRFIKHRKKLRAGEYARLKERLKLFEQNIFAPLLDNHKLTGKYEGYRSIDITGDLRALYKELGPDEVLFAYLGTHHELYET